MLSKKAASYEDLLAQVRRYCFLLLKFRMRSEAELRQRLKQKKFTPEIIEEAVDFLKDREFINDRVFAKAWVDWRVKRPYGLRRIAQELKVKGIAEEIISSCIEEKAQGYNEEEIVSSLIAKRKKAAKGVEAQKFKQRIWQYLLRRGFSPEIIMEKLDKIIA